MDLINTTKMPAAYTMGLRPDGRESLVVVVKGTFNLPKDGSDPILAEVQEPLIEADEFTGDPGFSAQLYESDYAPYKARCDVLLNGSAYAPDNEPTEKVTVKLEISTISKAFNVVGDRVWSANVLGHTPSPIEKFTVMPISYDRAFGGVDQYHDDEAKHGAYMQNPIGRGYHLHKKSAWVDDTPLPNTEETGQPIEKFSGQYRPMAYGCVGRGWEPRYLLAGTYDDEWTANVFPFLPADFNADYFQSAMQDQQMEYIKGGEVVELTNLIPEGTASFKIPTIEVPVVFFLNKDEPEKQLAVADTLIIEPDQHRFMIIWRASRLLKKNIFEVPQILAGRQSKAWWRARNLGKDYYTSLAELSRIKRQLAKLDDE